MVTPLEVINLSIGRILGLNELHHGASTVDLRWKEFGGQKQVGHLDCRESPIHARYSVYNEICDILYKHYEINFQIALASAIIFLSAIDPSTKVPSSFARFGTVRSPCMSSQLFVRRYSTHYCDIPIE